MLVIEREREDFRWVLMISLAYASELELVISIFLFRGETTLTGKISALLYKRKLD